MKWKKNFFLIEFWFMNKLILIKFIEWKWFVDVFYECILSYEIYLILEKFWLVSNLYMGVDYINIYNYMKNYNF